MPAPSPDTPPTDTPPADAPPTDTLTVVSVTLDDPDGDYDQVLNFLDRKVRLVHSGVGNSPQDAIRLASSWAPRSDAMAFAAAGHGFGVAPRAAVVAQIIDEVGHPTATAGESLRDVLQEWSVRHMQVMEPGYFNNARVTMLGTRTAGAVGRVLAEWTPNVRLAESAGLPSAPDAMSLIPGADVVGDMARRVADLVPGILTHPMASAVSAVTRPSVEEALRRSDVVVGDYAAIVAFGVPELAGKTVVTSSVSPERLARLADLGVDVVLDTVPQPFDVTVDEATLQAMMMAVTGAAADRLTHDDLLDMIESAGLQPRVLYPRGYTRTNRFAFVIHPLSQQYFRNVEPLGSLAKISPPAVMDAVEKVMAYAPPMTYSRITGVESPTGAKAEGWLITVGGTPKELMAHDPEFTYKRLLAAAEIARKLGAQIMGLGAFTKVVGDAGVTVAKRAPLPITTGNSYSASGALWALHDAIERMGLVDVDERGRMHGKAMVLGATGAIGSVCARLLAMATDELWLVSPEPAKLLALKADIETEDPRAVVHVAATPDEHLAEMDAIVTATSGAGKRVLDIMRVKPGCVITDVARPLDLSAEDVAKRPDVLVVESGEITLPGDVDMRNIGLPDGVAYACLAETIVLALEGRYETFTIGRNIEWPKVKEIYKLGLKHGMRLASISGINGVYTDEDIASIRDLALAARAGGA